MKKTFILAAALVVMVLLLTGCSSNNGIEGNTWKHVRDLGSYETISFSNGTCVTTYVNTVTGEKQSYKSTYTINGNKITVDGSVAEWKVVGNQLILTENGNSITLEKN